MPTKNNPTKAAIKEQRLRKKQQQRNLLVYGIIAGGIGLVLLLLLPTIFNALKPVGEITTPEFTERSVVDFNTMGDPNAPVKIVEYSDFQCPFCARFANETEAEIVQNYVNSGKVYFTYVPYGPGGNYIGPESEAAAQAAFCAAEQGKFWEFKETVFANHTGENVGDYTDKRLVAMAEIVGLDMTQFKSCFSSNKYTDKLNEGIAQGRAQGAGGTPFFIFNDGAATINGAEPFSSFQAQIEALLNE